VSLLLSGGFVYQEGQFSRCDVAIDGQRIALISPNISSISFDHVLQFNDCFIIPGLLDVHVHLRQPGFSYKETVATGTLAAARGGYTAVCAMPNLDPCPDSPEHLALEQQIIDNDAIIDVYPYACITHGQRGKELVDIETLAPRVIGFSDDGRGVQDIGLMREAMNRVAASGSIIAAHCEDETLLNGGYIHDGDYARKHWHTGIPSASEYKQLERDLELVRDTKCRYHVCHVSTKESVGLIRAAKQDGLPVSCETAPHYLLLCDSDLRDEGRFKMNPPLRSEADRDALVQGLTDGTVDMIATDHAPHSAAEKNRGLKDSVFGITGLETAFRILHTRLVSAGVITIQQLVEKMSVVPREIFNIGGGIEVGQRADMCVIDPDITSTIDSAAFYSMGKATPFDGMYTLGDIAATISGGKVVWQNSTTQN